MRLGAKSSSERPSSQDTGHAVVLIHGWPYDLHRHASVGPLLTSASYRVIVLYLRGYGATRVLFDTTFRTGATGSVKAC